MNKTNLEYYPQDLKSAIFKVLLRRMPPELFSDHLEDVVYSMINALSEGDLGLSLDANNKPSDLKLSGWPAAHKEALLKIYFMIF